MANIARGYLRVIGEIQNTRDFILSLVDPEEILQAEVSEDFIKLSTSSNLGFRVGTKAYINDNEIYVELKKDCLSILELPLAVFNTVMLNEFCYLSSKYGVCFRISLLDAWSGETQSAGIIYGRVVELDL